MSAQASSGPDPGPQGEMEPQDPHGTIHVAPYGLPAFKPSTVVPLGRPGAPLIKEETQPYKKRGTVACRRCRRLRSKCVHDSTKPPCEACGLAGPAIAAECVFPRKGEKDTDRRYRRRPPPVQAGDTPSKPPAPKGRAAPLPSVGAGMPPRPPSRLGGQGNLSSVPWYGPMPYGQMPVEQDISPHGNMPIYPTGHPTPSNSGSLSLASIIRGYSDTPRFPPLEEAVEGCHTFVTSYFQLGFIPKNSFLDSLSKDPFSINTFLLASILSISARFTPSLVRRYGSARRASDHFLGVAREIAPSQMYNTTLQSIEAFFLLAIAQWGHGNKDRSGEDMAVALRMALQLRLHHEDSYTALEQSGLVDQVVQAESARRTFWMIYSQENLHSGYKSPMPFHLGDITTLLPCDEDDFASGAVPKQRSALAGTPPAQADHSLISSPQRCLFATLIQAHGLWGKVARSASHEDHAHNSAPPWEPNSEYQLITSELKEWEEGTPKEQQYNEWNYNHWKAKNAHLAFLSVTMVVRLGNIVARRIYMDDILRSMSASPPHGALGRSTPTMRNDEQSSPTGAPLATPTSMTHESHGTAPAGFWNRVSSEIFWNVKFLHVQIETYFKTRAPEEGFPQILVFCVYMCGSLASYLWRYPQLCPPMANSAECMAQHCLEVLTALHSAWPTSAKWQKGLQQTATPLAGPSPALESEQLYHLSTSPGYDSHQQIQPVDTQFVPLESQYPPLSAVHPFPHGENRPVAPEGMINELISALPNGQEHLAKAASTQTNGLSTSMFEMDLNAFLNGDFHYDLMDGWQNDYAA